MLPQKVGKRWFLFAGDAIWHDGKSWKSYPTKAGRKQMIASLETLADTEFDVLLANTTISNPVCFIELTALARREFISGIVERL